MDALVFSVTLEEGGGLEAHCLQQSIFTQADTWEDLREAVVDAVKAWHFDRQTPDRVRLHLVRDELLAMG